MEIDFRGQMSIFKGGKGLVMLGVSVPFPLLVLRKGIAFVLELLGAHKTVLGGLKADKTELFL